MTAPSTRPVAIVTGGGSGIGLATAKHLTDAGWDVAITGRRSVPLEEAAAKTGAHALVSDMRSASAGEEIVDAVMTRFGRIDGLVLNAAVSHAGHFEDITDSAWHDMLETNLIGAARLTRAALPHFSEEGASIVGVASLAALRASSFMSGYAASKAGLGLMLQSVAVEFGKRAVRANLVCPGLVRTEMSASALRTICDRDGITLEEAYRVATENVPLRRAAAPSEIASVIGFLLSKGSSYPTGAIIPIDGGASAVDVAALVYDDKSESALAI
ncbi:MAG: SDR family oxidoreductase [Sinomonas sp.]|nr:SDR family oxidoreductase [Sinomonas sp.]